MVVVIPANLGGKGLICLDLELILMPGRSGWIRIARHAGLPVVKSWSSSGSKNLFFSKDFNGLKVSAMSSSGTDAFDIGMIYSYGGRHLCCSFSGSADLGRSTSGSKVVFLA